MNMLEMYMKTQLEKTSGAIAESLKRLNLNTPAIRKQMARDIAKGRKILLNDPDFGMKGWPFTAKASGANWQANTPEILGRQVITEFSPVGLPLNVMELTKGQKTRINFIRDAYRKLKESRLNR